MKLPCLFALLHLFAPNIKNAVTAEIAHKVEIAQQDCLPQTITLTCTKAEVSTVEKTIYDVMTTTVYNKCAKSAECVPTDSVPQETMNPPQTTPREYGGALEIEEAEQFPGCGRQCLFFGPGGVCRRWNWGCGCINWIGGRCGRWGPLYPRRRFFW